MNDAELLDEYQALQEDFNEVIKKRDEYALLLFQPKGAEHHNATECPYCKEYLNGKI